MYEVASIGRDVLGHENGPVGSLLSRYHSRQTSCSKRFEDYAGVCEYAKRIHARPTYVQNSTMEATYLHGGEKGNEVLEWRPVSSANRT